jgi:Heterokaryon incompatibility protein (HET)
MDIRAIVNYPHTIFDSRHRKPDGNDISNSRTTGNDRQAVSKRSPTQLFRSRTSLRPQDDLLCDRCRKIDLEDVFRPSYQHAGGREIMSLGEIDLSWKTCPLCRLFGAVHVPVEPGYRRPKNRGHHLRAFHMKPPEEIPDNVHRNIHYAPVVVLGVLHGFSRNERVAWAKQECFAHGVIAEARLPGSPSLPRPSFNGNLVEYSRVNYSQVRTWLTHCRKFHAGSCESLAFVRTTPSNFIDCFTRQVVQSPPAEEYFALSYVWGNPKNSSLDIEPRENLHFLPPSGIPQVFEDVIHVVKNLGGRSLWVDRYCIDQQNLDEKHEQIQNMDQIYEGATLTLVAVAGTNADCGLPGVHGLSRIFHPRAVIGDKVLVSTFPHISFPIRESAWTTRGWTYQEAILSRRCLFFTKQQVYFVCRAMTCQEAVKTLPYMSIAPPETRAMTTTLSLEIFGHEKPHRSTSRPQVAYLQNFYSHLIQYKRRQLTYDSDSLNAFKGILA